MKINISGLMILIKDLENKLSVLTNTIMVHAQNKKIIELSGKENIMEDYHQDFVNELQEYENITQRITYLKSVLYSKNNEFKLTDGRSIQTAIVDNANLRKLKELYDGLLLMKNSKTRVTEVNNSYFEAIEVNFNEQELKDKTKSLEERIYETDFEISKLNSIEFEIQK